MRFCRERPPRDEGSGDKRLGFLGPLFLLRGMFCFVFVEFRLG